MKLLSENENPEGLHNRYIVSKVNGEPVDDDAEYFVLRLDKNGDDPIHIEASRQAILMYASIIKDHMPKLSNDIFKRYSHSHINKEL